MTKRTPTERVRLTEMRERWAKKNPNKPEPTNADIAAAVFTDKASKKRMGEGRMRSLIARWNTGHDFGQLTPGRLKRLAAFLDCKADDLLSE